MSPVSHAQFEVSQLFHVSVPSVPTSCLVSQVLRYTQRSGTESKIVDKCVMMRTHWSRLLLSILSSKETQNIIFRLLDVTAHHLWSFEVWIMPCHNAVMTSKSEFSKSPKIDRNRSKMLPIDPASHPDKFQIDVWVFQLLLGCPKFLWPHCIRELWTDMCHDENIQWNMELQASWNRYFGHFSEDKMVRNKMVRNFVVRNKLALYLVGRSKLVRDLLMPGVSRFEILHPRKVVTAKI